MLTAKRSPRTLAGLMLCFLLAGWAASAAEPVVIDDFEGGAGGWYEVDGNQATGGPAICKMTTAAGAKQGLAAARLQFAACPKSWAHMQLNIRTLEWSGADCDRVALWLKGDGSGETFNLMFGNYEHKPALCFMYPIKLDFSDWKRFVVPFKHFKPEGFAANCGDIVLIQLNVNSTQKPVDILIDDICVLPADRGGKPGGFYDLDVPTTNGWDLPAPKGHVTVDPLSGIPAGVTIPRLVHGIGNHKDLHNPVAFAVDYAEPGTFAVKVATTSGYGGAGLIISVDGQEKLHKAFPGKTETELTQFQGYYAVDVPAGKHVVKVDNDGADWIQVEAYRLHNYGRGNVTVSRDDQAVVVSVLGPDGKGLPDLRPDVRVIGREVGVNRQPDGRWKTASLRNAYPSGRYPVTVAVQRGGQVIYAGTTTVTTATERIEPVRTAFSTGEALNLQVRYLNPAGVPLTGRHLTARLQDLAHPERPGAEVALREESEGVYSAIGAPRPAGVYEMTVPATGPQQHKLRVLVYDPKSTEIANGGIIKLAKNGRFVTQGGKDFTPWGFATIGMFAPSVEHVMGAGEWAFASDDAVRNWIGLLKSYGINVVRFGVNVDSMKADQGGHLSPDIAARLRHFLDLIGPLGVRALPVMWWGHYHNFSFDGIKPYDDLIKTQADWFTKPEALALQKQYVREVVGPYANDPRIFAWEVMNETCTAGGDRPAAIHWTNDIIDAMHEADPNHLITISACEATPAEEIEWIAGAKIDFFNWHAYPTYPDYGDYRKQAGNDSPREIGCYAALMAMADANHGKTVILGETGNDRIGEVDYPEFKTLITRDCLWMAYLCGSPGGISWDAIADPREFDVISRVAGQFAWQKGMTPRGPVVVAVNDERKELGNLARYAWWALENCVGMSFTPATSSWIQPNVSAGKFAPPATVASPLACSPGYQGKYLAALDGKGLIAYVRNVAGVLPQNVRTRTPKPLQVRLTVVGQGKLDVWDLDERKIVKSLSHRQNSVVDLGLTAHDFALVLHGEG